MTRSPRLGVCQAGVYAAEAETLAGAGRRWRRVGEAQAYVDELVGSEWFAERWPDFTAATVGRRGRGARWSVAVPEATGFPGGGCTEGTILLAGPDLTQSALLHELAHLLAHPDDSHGPAFARIHLELVRREMGFVAYREYRAALGRVPALAGVDTGPI